MKSKLIVAAALVLSAGPLAAAAALAQSPGQRALTGAVVLGERPMGDVPVTLHRVTSGESGAVDSTRTTSDGTFRFVLPARDSAAFEVYFATAEYLSVRYFGDPVHGDEIPAGYRVAVRDTTSALPGAVRVARRDIVLIPETAGGWEANEIVQIENGADRTIVAPEGLPTWEMALPVGATDFQAGEGELTAAEIALMGDRVLHLAPVLPGRKEIFLRYRLPAGISSATLPIGTLTDSMHIFVAQPSPGVEVTGLISTNVVDVQGQQFMQYGATALTEGSEVSFRWDVPAAPPFKPELAGGAAALLVLVMGTWIAVRRSAA